MNNSTPGDYIGYGLLVIVLGAVAAGVASAVAETVALLWIAAVPAAIGGVIMQIGVIGWGVCIGVRAAQQDGRTHP